MTKSVVFIEKVVMASLPRPRHPRVLRSHRLARTLVAVLAASALAASACSTDASTRTAAADKGPTTTAAPVTTEATIPAGVTLRVGDQLDYLKTVLSLAGEDRDFDYTVEYSAFIGGPPMLQAFQAGSLDTGFVGSTPLIFAQAGGQQITAVAQWASKRSAYELVASGSAKTDITSWADLKGRKVAFQQGTAGEAALLQALDTVGLELSDITPVNLPQTQIAAAIQGGSADAGLSIEPLTSLLLQSAPDAVVVDQADELTDRSSFVIATQETLADAGKTAALADYIARLVRSFAYLADHPDAIAESVYAKQYGLPIERAKEIVAAAGGAPEFQQLPGAIVKPQQQLADLFHAAGEIPAELDVSSEFDGRFNDVIKDAAS